MRVIPEKQSTISIQEVYDKVINQQKGILLWITDYHQFRFIKLNTMRHSHVSDYYWVSLFVRNGQDSHYVSDFNRKDLKIWIEERISEGDEFYYFQDEAEFIDFIIWYK